MPDHTLHVSSPVWWMMIDHGHGGACQRHAREDNHAAGMLTIMAGRRSRAIENFSLRIRRNSWYVTRLLEFSRSPSTRKKR
jgi:hypothetical protein